VYVDGNECYITAMTSEKIVCNVPEGQGKVIGLTVDAATVNADARQASGRTESPDNLGTDYISGIITDTAGFHNPSVPFMFNYESPVVSSISPDEVSTVGGTLVTLTGENFGTHGTVKLGQEMYTLPNLAVVDFAYSEFASATNPSASSDYSMQQKTGINGMYWAHEDWQSTRSDCDGSLCHTQTKIVFSAPEDYGYGGGRKVQVDLCGERNTTACHNLINSRVEEGCDLDAYALDSSACTTYHGFRYAPPSVSIISGSNPLYAETTTNPITNLSVTTIPALIRTDGKAGAGTFPFVDAADDLLTIVGDSFGVPMVDRRDTRAGTVCGSTNSYDTDDALLPGCIFTSEVWIYDGTQNWDGTTTRRLQPTMNPAAPDANRAMHMKAAGKYAGQYVEPVVHEHRKLTDGMVDGVAGDQLPSLAFECGAANNQCQKCDVVHQTHQKIICKPGPAKEVMGKNLHLVVAMRPQLDKDADERSKSTPAVECDVRSGKLADVGSGGGEDSFPADDEIAGGEEAICTRSSVCDADTGKCNSNSFLSFAAPIVELISPTRYPDATGGKEIILRGQNFGEFSSGVTIFIGGTDPEHECTNPQWHDCWKPNTCYSGGEINEVKCRDASNLKVPEFKTPYVSCTTPVGALEPLDRKRNPNGPKINVGMRVGWQALHITVAGQTVVYNGTEADGKLKAECKGGVPGYYGQEGELCTACPACADCFESCAEEQCAGCIGSGCECGSIAGDYFDSDFQLVSNAYETCAAQTPCQPDVDGNLPNGYVEGTPCIDWNAALAVVEVGAGVLPTCKEFASGCDGLATPLAKEGWWNIGVASTDGNCPGNNEGRSTDNSRSISENEERAETSICPYYVPCEPREACVGENVCAEAYQGERCSKCAKGYYKISGECEPCPDCPVCIILLFLAFAAGAGVCTYILTRKKIHLGVISIGVDYFQVLSVLASSNQVVWPSAIKDFFNYLSIFSLNLDLMAPECSFSFPYHGKWFVIEFLPIIACSCFFMSHMFKWAHKKYILGRTKKLHNHRHLVIGTSLITFYYLYLYITKTSLDIFNCSPTVPPEPDGKEYLEAVFVECYAPGGLHMMLLPWAVFFFIFYSMGYPALVAFILFNNVEKVKEDQILRARNTGESRSTNPHCYDFRKRYHMIYYQFKPHHFYWILLILLRKFSIASSGLLFRRTPVFLLSFILLVLFICYALQVRHQPYMSLSERAEVVAKFEAAQSGMDSLQARIKAKEIKKRGRQKLKFGAKMDRERRMEAAQYFWNYNTVESVLLFCGCMVVLGGLMFQSAQVDEGSGQGYAILVIVMLIIICSIMYFTAVLLTEILIGLGVGETIIKLFFKEKKGGVDDKDNLSENDSLERTRAESEVIMMANPTAAGGGGDYEDGGASATDLKQAHQTIQQLQNELKDLKKKVQTQTLKGYNSSKKNMGKKKTTAKKTFAGNDGTAVIADVEGVNPMLRDQDQAFDGGEDKNELI